MIITETASIIMAVSYEDSQFEKLLQIIDEKVFTPKEAAQALSIKKSSAYWLLHTLVRDQRLSRIARGYYTVAPDLRETGGAPSLSNLSQQIVSILRREGIEFYITGLDILTPFFDQMPASFPPLVYVQKGSSDWVLRSLTTIDAPVLVNPKKGEISIARIMRSGADPIIVRETAEFSFTNGVLASTEKAFVDVYYEITRGYYEFSVGDLAHMLVAYETRGHLNPVRMIGAARRRRIDAEIRYMLDVCFGMFHKYARPTIRLSQPVQQFIHAVQKIRSEIAHGKNQ